MVDKLLPQAKLSKLTLEQAALNDLTGGCYNIKGDYQQAISFFTRAKDLQATLGDSLQVARLSEFMGIVYRNMGQFKDAMQWQLNALGIRQRQGTTERISSIYINIATLYGLMSNLSAQLQALQKAEADLWLLDIDLNGTSVFELLKKLDTISGNLVFVTAYSEHAVRAFEFSAIDYLLKPFSMLHLERAIQRVSNLPGYQPDW